MFSSYESHVDYNHSETEQLSPSVVSPYVTCTQTEFNNMKIITLEHISKEVDNFVTDVLKKNDDLEGRVQHLESETSNLKSRLSAHILNKEDLESRVQHLESENSNL